MGKPVLDSNKQQYVYLAADYRHSMLKVGCTQDPARRFATLIGWAHSLGLEDLYFARIIEGGFADEKRILALATELRISGTEEWMLPSKPVIEEFRRRPSVRVNGICEHGIISCRECEPIRGLRTPPSGPNIVTGIKYQPPKLREAYPTMAAFVESRISGHGLNWLTIRAEMRDAFAEIKRLRKLLEKERAA